MMIPTRGVGHTTAWQPGPAAPGRKPRIEPSVETRTRSLARTTTVPAILSCQACFSPSKAIQMNPRKSATADRKQPRARTIAVSHSTGRPSSRTTFSPRRSPDRRALELPHDRSVDGDRPGPRSRRRRQDQGVDQEPAHPDPESRPGERGGDGRRRGRGGGRSRQRGRRGSGTARREREEPGGRTAAGAADAAEAGPAPGPGGRRGGCRPRGRAR